MMGKLEDLVSRCKGPVDLEVNGNRASHQSRREYLGDDADEMTDGEIEALDEAEAIYRLQFYPSTPVGFYVVYGTSLDHVVGRALGVLNAGYD